MGIGAGLAASSGFFADQEHLQDRAYLQQQRDYQNKQNQAGLSTLDDRTSADRAAAKLAAARSAAGLDMLPGETNNQNKANQLRGVGLDFDLSQAPVQQGIAAQGLAYQAETQPKEQRLKSAGLDMAVANIPDQNAARVANNANAMSQQHMQALVALGQRLSANDKTGALEYVNKMADGKRQFVDIHAKGDLAPGGADTRAFDLVDSTGKAETIPYSALNQAMSMAKTGKYSMHVGRAGDVHILNENTGDLKTPVPADPNYARTTGGNQHTPAQLQLVNAYMSAPENKGMTFSQAMDKVKTSLEKPRHQAILDLVGKNLLPGGDPNKEYQKWADLYDHAKGSAPGASAPSNKGAAGTMAINPKYQSLFK